jgi:hypothetical protein
MKKLLTIIALSLIILSGYGQSKGPKYKNSKIADKYKGNNTILIYEDPTQFKGPKKKNFKSSEYQIEVIDVKEIQLPNINITDSIENKNYSYENEKIIFRRVKTKDMKGKNTKGLKGPAYKNYK